MTQPTEAELLELYERMVKCLDTMAHIYEKRFPHNLIVAEALKLAEKAEALKARRL